MRKLSAVMERAQGKLTDEWQTPFMLGESILTLEALVERGLAKGRGYQKLGAIFSPRATLEFRKAHR